MWKEMNMLVVHMSESLQKANHCQEMLLKSYQLHGEWEQKGTTPRSQGLSSFVVKGKLIPFKQPIEFLTECFKTGVGYSSILHVQLFQAL